MESLEQRKAKFKQYMDKAQAYEARKDLPDALKAYQQALKYSMHKKDTDHINAKIIKLKDMVGYVSGMLGEGKAPREGGLPWLWLGLGGLILLLLVGGVILVVFKPFG